MSYDEQTKQIIDIAKKLLESGEVATVLGFGQGGVEGGMLPVFAQSPAEADRLVWNGRCVPPLAAYLPGAAGIANNPAHPSDGKVAIVAKPCDARAIANLIVENQLKREDVHIIGMECAGMRDKEGNMLSACLECTVHAPPIYDELIKAGGPIDAAGADRSGEEFDEARFAAEMDKCILCFSCRQACYGCYCDTCFMDRGVPSWQAANPDFGSKMVYHLGRAMHLAGRCVECGSCENTCASGVDVRYLIREVSRFVDGEYGFRAGLDTETPPAMITYKTEDREIGFWGEGDAAHG